MKTIIAAILSMSVMGIAQAATFKVDVHLKGASAEHIKTVIVVDDGVPVVYKADKPDVNVSEALNLSALHVGVKTLFKIDWNAKTAIGSKQFNELRFVHNILFSGEQNAYEYPFEDGPTLVVTITKTSN